MTYQIFQFIYILAACFYALLGSIPPIIFLTNKYFPLIGIESGRLQFNVCLMRCYGPLGSSTYPSSLLPNKDVSIRRFLQHGLYGLLESSLIHNHNYQIKMLPLEGFYSMGSKRVFANFQQDLSLAARAGRKVKCGNS